MQTNGVNLESKILVLHGSPLTREINVSWEQAEDIQPINVCITDSTVQTEVGTPLNWSMNLDLIEVDDVQAVVIKGNIQMNSVILKAKQDTGAQINIMSMTVFKDIQKVQKLPLYPKSCVKLVGYGNRIIDYLGTTKVECVHNGTKVNALFYVTNVIGRPYQG